MRLPDTANQIAGILRNGGEAIIIDDKTRTHFVSVGENGAITMHIRYQGNPGVIVPALSAAFENGGVPKTIAGVTGLDML